MSMLMRLLLQICRKRLLRRSVRPAKTAQPAGARALYHTCAAIQKHFRKTTHGDGYAGGIHKRFRPADTFCVTRATEAGITDYVTFDATPRFSLFRNIHRNCYGLESSVAASTRSSHELRP